MPGKRFSGEFIQKALDVSEKIGCQKAAEELGITAKQIYDLRSKYKKKLSLTNISKLSKKKIPKDPSPKAPKEAEPQIEFQMPEMVDETFKRGKIYYISKATNIGSEIAKGRPGVIVSNNSINKNLNTIEVVYLTTQARCVSPEHVVIKSSGVDSITVCEQISTIDKSRIREYVGECTAEEMNAIDKAMLNSLALNDYVSYSDKEDPNMIAIKTERDVYKKLYNELLNKLTKDKEK